MSIPMSKYVNITSGIGGASQVPTRQFMGNIFTTSGLVDPLAPLIFSGGPSAALTSIAAYFGIASEEYLRAAMYFSYVSPSIRTPQRIMYSRYCDVDSPCRIYGAPLPTLTLAGVKTSIAGLLSFNFNGTIVSPSAVDLSASTSLSDAAARLQTALRLNASPFLTTCTVTYDATNNRLVFTASSTGVATGSLTMVPIGTGVTDLATLLNWSVALGAIIVSSQILQTPLQAFQACNIITNNFGSLCFTYASNLTLAQQTAIAQFNAALNVVYQFEIPVNASNYVAAAAALAGYAGVGLTYDTNLQYQEQIPMAILAATDYTQRNGVTNFMYRQLAGMTAAVTNPTLQAALDLARVNYVGQVQFAGQFIAFYQDGVLGGGATAPVKMNIFANEQWFKDYVASQILNLQLTMPEVSANSIGRGQILNLIQAAITQALYNGTISVGKPLTTVQQLYVTQLTGDQLAWLQVQNIGYWLEVTLSSSVQNGMPTYNANYTLVYNKNDAVYSVQGTHVLI